MPTDEEYGRVSDAERYRQLHAAAADLLADIERLNDVVVTRGGPEIDPDLASRVDGCQQLAAIRVGGHAAVTIAWTTFPGVLVRTASGEVSAFPRCGCDACNERVDDLAEELRATVRSELVAAGIAQRP